MASCENPVMNDLDRRFAEMTLDAFTESLASDSPAPGGGAAAAIAASLAAGLTAMVVRLSIDRPRFAEHAPLHAEALAASDAARLRFLELADADAAAYASYRDARRLPHETEAEEEAREEATRAAARSATQVPMDLVKASHAQIELVDRVVGRSNRHAASDLEAAALLLECAARLAAANVRVNLDAIGDESYAHAVTAELDQRIQQMQSSAERIHERITKGASRPPEER
jgi:formiminotetrahydrofolate cyclodeaminase